MSSMLFAYVGPDTFLPVTSALSALAGVVMFLWGTGMKSVVRGFAARFRRRTPAATPVPVLARRRRPGAGPVAPQAVDSSAVRSE